ncbi:hypothetical protein [Falsihalocynthiibacter arcticus]|uniref:hypothetical protein n=1 Tax=Falsihalocynthiibacter arcticus TaxID=1579316 RepID=UPI00300334C5
MGQNTSSAVMQQRTEARDALDDFPTPMWATRVLTAWLEGQGYDLSALAAREPCANRGYMAVPLGEAFGCVEASDVHDYGVGYPVLDYLFGAVPDPLDFTISNPPFRLAAQIIDRALASSHRGVAMFVRSAFLEGGERYHTLFSQNPPTTVLQFSERVILHKGLVRFKGEKYVDKKGVERSASSATAYSWLVWNFERMSFDLQGKNTTKTQLEWLPPCCASFERLGDYEERGTYG